MCDKIPDKIQVIHFLLYEYHQESNATSVAKRICVIYPKAISQYYEWYSRFRYSDI